MTPTPAPAKSRPAPPPPPRASAAAPNQAAPPGKVIFGKVQVREARRIGIFGPGGVGKTTLAATAPGPVAVIDLDESLSVLTELHGLDLRPVPVGDWKALLTALNAPGWEEIKTIVVDPATRTEEFAVAETILTVKHEKGNKVTCIEDYGYGKGYQHVYDTFLPLLGALDQHVRAGRNVVLVMHDCTANVPNPSGEDWIRYEPRMQSPVSGKASIRLRIREWLDDLLFMGFDVAVDKEGKGTGAGTRTIWPNELPHCMAKSRKLVEPIPMEKFSTVLWERLFAKGE